MNDLKKSDAPVWVQRTSAFIRHIPVGRYRLMNWLPRSSSQPFWMSMPHGLGGSRFHCDLKDSIAREVCFTGQYEPQETALVQSLLRPEMVFVDVGANWGYYTLLAAHFVSPGGRVVSLEPDPRLFPILAENINHNQLQCVTALQIAAASQTGTLTLSGFDDDGENHGLSKLIDRDHGYGPSFQVQARAVDDVLDELEIGDVDLLKMDIEGAEDLALKGMISGLDRGRYRRVILELHPSLLAERGISTSEILDLMIDRRYSGWWIDFSPSAMRKAAYASSIRLQDYLRPVDKTNPIDSWPHVLWLAPGTELPT